MNNLLLIGSMVMSACGHQLRRSRTECMSGNKNLAVKFRDKTVDLKETKDLYGRLIVLSRSCSLSSTTKIRLEISNSQ